MKPEHQTAMLNAQKLLSNIGVEGSKKPSAIQETEPDSLKAMMERKGIGLEDLIEELAMKVKSGNEGLSSRAIDTALKMHGALKESASGPTSPSFTINIIESKTEGQPSRQENLNLPVGVNPIFVPRQLLARVSDPPEKSSN